MADVLIFGAHPDDIEFGMGGTALLLAKQGYEVVWVVLTRGEMGTKGNPHLREQETREAARFAGCKVEFLDFVDCHVEDTIETRKRIAKIVRRHRPGIVFAPYFDHKTSHREGISHPDHAALGQIVRIALRLAKFKNMDLGMREHFVQNVFYYMVPCFRVPSFVIDISAVKKDWVALAKRHKSYATPALLRRLGRYREQSGALVRVDFGEGFLVEEPLRLSSRDLLRA